MIDSDQWDKVLAYLKKDGRRACILDHILRRDIGWQLVHWPVGDLAQACAAVGAPMPELEHVPGSNGIVVVKSWPA